VETGRVFTDRFGRAVKPNSDYHAWEALFKRAGVRVARTHDARHTAATVLLALEVPERIVMGVMGWSLSAGSSGPGPRPTGTKTETTAAKPPRP
jgi:integrase